MTSSRRMRFLRLFNKPKKALPTAVITDAQESPGQERHRREKTYAFLMFLRVPSLLATVWLIYAYQAWIPAAVISAITIPLPWLAVMFANARGPKKDKGQRAIYKPGLARQAKEYAYAHSMLTNSEMSAVQPGSGDPSLLPDKPHTVRNQNIEVRDSPRHYSPIIDHIANEDPEQEH